MPQAILLNHIYRLNIDKDVVCYLLLATEADLVSFPGECIDYRKHASGWGITWFAIVVMIHCADSSYFYQERSQNAEKVTHIEGRLPDQGVILFNFFFKMGPFLNGKNLIRGSEFFPLRAVVYGMETHFYRIRRPPLNDTIFITFSLRMCIIA